MSQIDEKLRRLRTVFVVYFIAKLGIEIFLTRDMLSGRGLGLERLGMSAGALLTVMLLTTAALFALGWWLFSLLLLKKSWARIVLLIVAWLAVFDAFSTFLFTPHMAGVGRWLGRMVPGVEWRRLLLVDRISDLLGLLYWGYAIYVLQVDPDVKKKFFPPKGAGANE